MTALLHSNIHVKEPARFPFNMYIVPPMHLHTNFPLPSATSFPLSMTRAASTVLVCPLDCLLQTHTGNISVCLFICLSRSYLGLTCSPNFPVLWISTASQRSNNLRLIFTLSIRYFTVLCQIKMLHPEYAPLRIARIFN